MFPGIATPLWSTGSWTLAVVWRRGLTRRVGGNLWPQIAYCSTCRFVQQKQEIMSSIEVLIKIETQTDEPQMMF